MFFKVCQNKIAFCVKNPEKTLFQKFKNPLENNPPLKIKVF